MGKMPAWLRLSLAPLKMVVGAKGVEILVGGEKRGTLRIGETTRLGIIPGERAIQTILHGVLWIKRKSKVLAVLAKEGEQVVVLSTYTRMSGNVGLKLA
ncbi:MAG: hypothetical protein ACE5LS_07895 [Thermoplasmata archaeon]